MPEKFCGGPSPPLGVGPLPEATGATAGPADGALGAKAVAVPCGTVTPRAFALAEPETDFVATLADRIAAGVPAAADSWAPDETGWAVAPVVAMAWVLAPEPMLKAASTPPPIVGRLQRSQDTTYHWQFLLTRLWYPRVFRGRCATAASARRQRLRHRSPTRDISCSTINPCER